MDPKDKKIGSKLNRLNIGILSGKGGTGKTTVATNLAKVLQANYIDCDVEEPNGFIFLKPTGVKARDVLVEYPVINSNNCVLCNECIDVCQFKALARLRKEILVFEQLCHACGACQYVCKYGAITYEERKIGIIEEGKYNNSVCKRGILNIGEPMAVPVIKELLKDVISGVNILDLPPGTSCNVVNALHSTDFALLVTEPTKFGLHDLKMAVKLVKEFDLEMGLIINKSLEGESLIHDYCSEEGIMILGEIPYSKSAAVAYSNGEMLIELAVYKKVFEEIARKLKEVF